MENDDTWDRTKRVCANCKHWHISNCYREETDRYCPRGETGGNSSECRCDPPVLITTNVMGEHGKWTEWPETYQWDWCGKFESRWKS